MFQSLLEKIALGLDRRGIGYMVIGGQAVLVHGEPGSGRTTAVREMVGEDYVSLDAADIADLGEPAWLSHLDGLLSTTSAVVIEAVHLLPEPIARRVAREVRSARARVVRQHRLPEPGRLGDPDAARDGRGQNRRTEVLADIADNLLG